MQLQAFFDNFTELAATQNGIPRLRQLILQLAFRGQLVPQFIDDGTAASLLKEIEVVRRGQQNGKAHKLPPVTLEERPHELPSKWKYVRLGDVVEYDCAQKVTPAQIAPNAWLLELEDIEKDSSRIIQRITFAHRWSKSTKAKFVAGDVLYGKLRPYLSKVVVADENGYCTTEIVALRGYLGIEPRFLMYALKRPEFITYVNEKSYGVKMPRLGSDDARLSIFPLPPFEEQKRIVKKIDELLGLCNELEVQQQAKRESRVRFNTALLAPLNKAASLTPEEFEQARTGLADNFDILYDSIDTVSRLRATILQLAVQGKLLPQDLSKRLVFDERNSRLPAHETLFRSPDSWDWKRFGEVAEIVSGVTKGRRLQGRKTYSYPYLRVANVQRWFLDLRVIKEIEILEGEIEKYRLQENDLLITEGGDWDKVGRTAIWQNQIKNCVHQNHVFRARLSDDTVIPFWAMMFLNSATGRRYFEAASKQTTNLASINMRQLRACPLPIPPLAEQKRIVAKVNQLMSLCDELEAKLRQAEADSEKLMNAAVKHVLDSVRDVSKTTEEVFA